jgi:hypothetical protein
MSVGVEALRQALFQRSGDGFWRRLLLALTLVAFAANSYVTQTHIHFAASAADDRAGVSEQSHGKGPAQDDPSRCPLCQEILLAGAYLTPVVAAIPPPAFTVFQTLSEAPAFRLADATCHDWHSRGPPLNPTQLVRTA